jgi:delta 1-pyrroline-5-carboxylate dehydrogenase
MLLRVMLIIALAAGLAGVGVTFLLKDKVTQLSLQRDQFKTDMETAQAEAARERQTARKATEEAKAATEKLASTEAALAEAAAGREAAESRAARLGADLERTTGERNTAQRDLAAWRATGLTPDRIEAVRREAERFKAERDAFAEEKKVMSREIARLDEEIKVFKGEITEIPLPDIRAKVEAVDNNYRFVVINKGSEDGLKENGKLIINRDGQLVAKVQIVRLEPRRLIANLLPDWQRSDVREGDDVITSYEALVRK